ncbi:MAG: hypothetical protein FD161_558 [Limisphaerales bacterium]|nr:MAG: hypothetical protein FD161_558 [Limisphaerales bacterium]KAG0510163.1 MAG: hypothetical protein E1N63_558 [Limisphaerales bacterium]TXT51954.1 MAG: hypothetical protein FD140_1342 [Limisphaerales bacterium]
MNPRGLLLVATLGANCVLAVLLFRPPDAPPSAGPAAAAGQLGSLSPQPKAAGARARSQAEPAATPEPTPAPPDFNWASIESEDFKKYIQNLRDLGVPDETIRELIRAEITKLYRPKMLALRPASNPEKYWERNYGPYNQQTAEQRRQQTALYKEQAELLKSLLGETPMASEHPLKRAFTNAPPEVLKQITELQTKFFEKQQALYEKTAGYIDGSATVERRKLEREFYDEVAKLTSPEQVQAYKLRNSDLSRNLREELRAFAPTEEEFKAIFRQRDAVGNPRDGVTSADASSPEQAQQMRQAQLKAQVIAEAAFAESFGPERAKEYKLLQDYAFRDLAEAGVARENLLRLAAMKDTAVASSLSIQRNTALSAEQRTTALQAIRTETEKELAGLLGERRAKAYPYSGGYWIQTLAPTVTTRVATP